MLNTAAEFSTKDARESVQHLSKMHASTKVTNKNLYSLVRS